MRSVAWIAAVAATLASTPRAASVCEIPGPEVPTLQASKENPALECTIASPDCSYVLIKATKGRSYVIENQLLQRVESVPFLASVVAISAPLSHGADFASASDLNTISLSSVSGSAKNFAFPGGLRTLTIENSETSDLEQLNIPNTVATLTIRENKSLKSLKGIRLPSALSTLDLGRNQLTAIDFELPARLKRLDLTGNPITKLERRTLPSSLEALVCNECSIQSVVGVRFASTLKTLMLGSGELKTFEIRRSDTTLLRRLADSPSTFPATIDQKQCADATAVLVATKRGNICVISDERFNQLYYGGPATLPSTSQTTTAAPGAVSTNDDPLPPSVGELETHAPVAYVRSNSTMTEEATTDEAQAATNEPSREAATDVLEQKPAMEEAVVDAKDVPDSPASSERGGRPGTTHPKSHENTTTSTTDQTTSSPNAIIIVFAVVGAVLTVVAGVVGYRVLVVARTKREQSRSESYTAVLSPLPPPHMPHEPTEPSNASPQFLKHVTTLQAYRIDEAAIRYGDAIAQGSHSMVYRGVFNSQSVVIKRMAPDSWKEQPQLQRFVDEIRVCVTLNHPKIVRSLGVSWSSEHDLAAIVEYMPGGDLLALLQSQSTPSTGHEWFKPWTASKIKSKTSIASDVAEAVAYLHALELPILHGGLQAKRVLLDLAGGAKLSGLGIHREEVSVDETMAREIGAVAWTAPEILRGERRSATADVYSLGVLMIEMDLCRHPYAHERVFSNEDTRRRSVGKNPIVMTNTKIAIQMSTGKLRPAPSAACPPEIRQLIDRCVSITARERPTAREVCQVLNTIQQR